MNELFKWVWGSYFYEPIYVIKVHGWRTATIKNGFGIVDTVTIDVWGDKS